MWRQVAPAGAPIGLTDLTRWARAALASADAEGVLCADICARFGVDHCVVTSTGRGGLTLLLRALRRLGSPTRDEVVLPSYTCYSVAASVVKAGLRPRIVDISPHTLDYSPEALEKTDCGRVLALVATNLYGMPNDLPTLCRYGRKHDVFVIDDAAQAMGATVAGRASGTWGDAGLFSFDKGKNVSSVDGGLLVTHSDAVAAALREEMAALPALGPAHSALNLAKVVLYAAFLRPWLYGLPSRIPQLGLGTTVFTTDFPLARADRMLVALAAIMMRRLDAFTQVRIDHASAIAGHLATARGVRLITPIAGSTPVYLRLPVLFDTPEARNGAVRTLNRAGIGGSPSYPSSLVDVPALAGVFRSQPVPSVGRYVAQRIATLPTHPFVAPRDLQAIGDILAECGHPFGADRRAGGAAVSERAS